MASQEVNDAAESQGSTASPTKGSRTKGKVLKNRRSTGGVVEAKVSASGAVPQHGPDANENHSEMRSVLEDLKSDYQSTASTQALQELENLEVDGSPMREPNAAAENAAQVIEVQKQLKAAKQAVKALRADKERTHQKLERLDGLLVKERSSLRDVLQAARKAFADLKLEKETMRNKLHAERKKHAAQLTASREETKATEKAVMRLEAEIRALEKKSADAELSTMPEEAKGAILKERENLSSALAAASAMHQEDAEELSEIDDEMQRLFAALNHASEEMAAELVQLHRGERQAELSKDNTLERVAKVTEQAKGDKERMQNSIDKKNAENMRLRAMLENAGLDPGPLEEDIIDFGEFTENSEGSLLDELGDAFT